MIIALSVSLIACTGLESPRAVYGSTSDSFPWSNLPVESSGDGAYVMEDSYGSLRDSNMSPDQIPQSVPSGLYGFPASGSALPDGRVPAVTLKQAGQMPFTPSQNAINAPGLTPQAGNYTRTDQGFIPTASENVVSPLNSLSGNIPIRGGDVPPGSTVSGSGVSVGNVDATQSGPGAAGLFTPNGPGNAAALSAQMRGGLEGSPIVDGSGTNLDIAVPIATPSEEPDYEHFTIDGTTGLMRDTVYSTGPIPGETIANPSAIDSLSAERNFDLTPIAPSEDGESRSGTTTLADLRGPLNPSTSITGKVTGAAQLGQPTGRAVSHTDQLETTARNRRSTKPQDPTNQIGTVTGAIDWGNGDVVLFGTQGELEEEKGNVGTLVLNSGTTKTVHGEQKEVRSIEEHM
jgi:hypothetical protein